jgi:hypothetical protein
LNGLRAVTASSTAPEGVPFYLFFTFLFFEEMSKEKNESASQPDFYEDLVEKPFGHSPGNSLSLFERLREHPNYVIDKAYPHEIYKISTGKRVAESIHSKKHGYLRVKIDNKYEYKHRLVALQWLENDDPINKIFVDHRNGNTFDFRLENLRWVTAKENNNNRHTSKGEALIFQDTISDESIMVEEYNNHSFDELFYDPTDGFFYFDTGVSYRGFRYNTLKNGSIVICARHVNNKSTMI